MLERHVQVEGQGVDGTADNKDDVRASAVGSSTWLTGDETARLGLDLVERKVYMGEVGLGEVRSEVF